MAHLPTSRIKTIMKSTADVDIVNKEAVYTLTRATELFLKLLASESYKDAADQKKIEYKNLANVAHKYDHLEFLREIIPQKITVKQYRELMAKKNQGSNGSGKTESGSSSDSESDGSNSAAESDSE